MKMMAYIRCFIDMSLYNNFNEESKAHELWAKIAIMFQNKNVVNRVSVFWKLLAPVPRWLKYVGAYECLPGVDKPGNLVGSTSR